MELVARGLFAIPALLNQGDHWYLSPDESRLIGEQANAAVSALPAKRVEQLIKLSNTWAPWIGLTTTVAVCLIARINYTRSLYVGGRTPGLRTPDREAAPHAPEKDGGAVPSNGAAAGSGAAKNRVAGIIRESEGLGSEPGGAPPESAGG